MPKYTKAKVPCTQDKHTQLSSFAGLCCRCPCPVKSLAVRLLEYIATFSQLTGYLRPCELDTHLMVDVRQAFADWLQHVHDRLRVGVASVPRGHQGPISARRSLQLRKQSVSNLCGNRAVAIFVSNDSLEKHKKKNCTKKLPSDGEKSLPKNDSLICGIQPESTRTHR